MKPNPTPGPRREPINLYGIRMTAYNHLYYGVGPFDSSQPGGEGGLDSRYTIIREPIRRAIEIWHSSVNRLPIHGRYGIQGGPQWLP